MTRTISGTFAPLAGVPDFNFKGLYRTQTASSKQFLLLLLHKMYSVSYDVYTAMSTPDIDVDSFVDIVEESLEGLKKQIPRCGDAFNIIRNSVGLLRDNFGSYYKGFMGSNNPTIIVESFIGDVATNSDASPRVMSQFKSIIKHYQKLTQQAGNDPRLQGALNVVNQAFGSMGGTDGGTDGDGEAEGADAEGAEGAECGDAAPAAAAAAAADPASTALERAGVDVEGLSPDERRKVADRERKRERERRKKADRRYEKSLADIFREEDAVGTQVD